MNIELRERTEEHVRIYFARTRDPEIQALLPQAAATVEEALESYRKTLLPHADSFGRTIYADGAYVGDIWCYGIDSNDEPNAMLSYCLFEKLLWGRGITTAAVKQFLADITVRFGLRSVGAFGYCANKASLRVLEKNGFAMAERFFEDGVASAYYQKNMGDK
ncbi:MAG: GNAT family N-acetyltransferase [Faecousia sp.]